jgi:fumarylacetoacetase
VRNVSPLEVAGDHAFSLLNLPFGAFAREGEVHLGTALGERIFDLHVAAHAHLFDDVAVDMRAVCCEPNLNALFARGAETWGHLRARLYALLSPGNCELADAGLLEHAFVLRSEARMVLPVAVADYVDFYSSLEHATNMGKLLRPGGEALTPNWRWLPIGYHGRVGSVVLSETPIARPCGQYLVSDTKTPLFAPTRKLDFELELGFVTGSGPARGARMTPDRAEEAIFGVVLLNDWSARDIQAWEYQPLGPFLGKSFATSIAPWVVPLAALEPFRVAGPVQEPAPLPHLAMKRAHGFEIFFEVSLLSERMRRTGMPPMTITRAGFGEMYWSMAQQLAHLSSNGSPVRAGDLYGSGTISGSAPGSYGSMAEITAMGRSPITLPNGETRAFLEDGDTVTMSGYCLRAGVGRVGLGSVSGTITVAVGES